MSTPNDEKQDLVTVGSDQIDLQDDDAVLRFALRQRLRVHGQIEKAGEGQLPMDSELGNFMHNNLAAIERSALSRAKIRADAESGQKNAAMMNEVLKAVLQQTRPTDNPYIDHEAPPRPAPALPDEIDVTPLDLPEGVTHIGVTHETIDDFMNRTSGMVIDTSQPDD